MDLEPENRAVAAAEGPGDAIAAQELASLLGTVQAPQLIDVREPDEFEAWSIPGAENIPLGTLSARHARIAPARRVAVICASGERSRRATETLRAAGVDAVNVAGGMTAWADVYDTAVCDLSAPSVVQVRRRAKGCLSYVIGAGGEALVVDPSMDVHHYQSIAAARGWRITRVIDTHLHADHVSGARAIAGATGASLLLSPDDGFLFDHDPLPDGAHFSLGDTEIRALHSPGHTEGSVVLDLGGRALVTGDTLFVDGVGRPDLAERAEEYASNLYATLRGHVLNRTGDVWVLPAHYGDRVPVVPAVPVAARLAEVLAGVPQLGWDRPEFVSWATSRATARPPRYVDIVRVNRGEVPVGDDERRGLEVGPNRCAAA